MKYQPILSVLLITALLAGVNTASAQAYRYTDPATGKTVISDQPPPKSVKGVQAESVRSGDAAGEITYAAARAAEKYPVILYTSADCTDPCVKSRDLLNKRGIPFTEKMVTTPELQEELTKLVGSAFTPSITIGKQVFKGFEPASWENLLDLAGYPKTAAFGSKPSGAFTK